jgi:preprotein translocase subunit SecA
VVKIKLARPGRPGGRDSGDVTRSSPASLLTWSREVVAAVNALEDAARASSDDDLRARTALFRGRLARGEREDVLLAEAFATVREAGCRSIGLRHHDVQIMGGAVLQRGLVAEMRTGEGKTLTATLPAYMGALASGGAHVMTANDYLARRDWGWMRPVFEFLGLTAGLLDTRQAADRAQQRAAYAADVTYGNFEQFGYDYLRDNLAWSPAEVVQRTRSLAVVDEADLVLVDSMRAGLQITAPDSSDQYPVVQQAAADLVRTMTAGTHFVTDRAAQTVTLTERGIRYTERGFGLRSGWSAGWSCTCAVAPGGRVIPASPGSFCRPRTPLRRACSGWRLKRGSRMVPRFPGCRRPSTGPRRPTTGGSLRGSPRRRDSMRSAPASRMLCTPIGGSS